ncbi:UBN2 domain-containing protein [Cucumis melo var. makuwa]|uniref:UBN2 domain-containing protein n=1 Tax=Cucumis melo var. makuwa TaxID=1194695 RepID=A0A5A7V170_CUCMM|nr:UBN2 domain-containing protein [Cucumis melo var. makuwa]TYK09887.1 UBN2 domain-containing protein [Cucumis melo var. makuwa]
MGSNDNAIGIAQPLIPIFKGEGYEFWSICMKTLLRSQDLWDLVEQGYVDRDDEGKLWENRKKDSKALVIIQQAVHDSVFSRIAAATTSKQAWLILQKAFQGDSRVFVVKLQSLRRDFETLMMKNEESISEFLSRATTIIIQMQTYGETIKDQTIVEKRANFATENEASENNGKGENKLFMTNIPSDQKTAEVWFIDSGCSNHMTCLKPVFKELNEGEKLKVELENGKKLQVEGKGTVGIETYRGNRILTNVQYVPDIGYNLLSVEQLMESGYSILFDDVSNAKSFAVTATATNTTKNNSELWHLRKQIRNIEKFKHFKAKVEKQSGMFIKSLRSDRGGEFLSNNFNNFCKEHGILRELTTPYTPEQNGVAERKNRTVVEMARSMLQMKCLLNDFLAEAVSTSIYLLNISPQRLS